MKKYKISMWNYVDAGVMDAERAVRDWKDAGINLPMSFEYKPVSYTHLTLPTT